MTNHQVPTLTAHEDQNHNHAAQSTHAGYADASSIHAGYADTGYAGNPSTHTDYPDDHIDRGNAHHIHACPALHQARTALEKADHVLIGGGAGLSTAAGLAYDGPRFERTFAAFIERYGISDMYSAGFYPFESLADYWAYWSLHIWVNRYEPGPTDLYRMIAQWAMQRDSFVITTNVDAQFPLAGIPRDRLFEPQGDYGLLQCSRGCHETVYDARQTVEAMLQDTDYGRNTTLSDESLIPYCPRCGAPMAVHVRCDSTFAQDDDWQAANDRYHQFVADIADRDGEGTVLLELGVGWNTPVWIRYPFEQIAHKTNATLIRINMDPTTTTMHMRTPTHAPASAIQITADLAQALPLLLSER